jgi:gliding motility-associated lipoprotein GldH
MKSIRLIMFALLSVLMFSSCTDKNVIFKENQKFSDLEWKRDDKKSFVLHIDDNRYPKQMILNFRYATGYRFDRVKMKMTEVNPEGERTVRDIEFKVRDEKGEFIGEKGYDIIDLAYELDANKHFPTHGDYTYIFEQTMPQGVDILHFAMEIGLEVKEKPAQ